VSPEELRPINVPARTLKQEDNRTEPNCFSPYLYRARNLVEQFMWTAPDRAIDAVAGLQSPAQATAVASGHR
jgi:hypothetical protein